MSNNNLQKVTELIVNHYWQSCSNANYTARKAFQNSLTKSLSDELGREIFLIAKSGNCTKQDTRDFIFKHKVRIDKRFKETSSDFYKFFNRYSGNEAIISMCLFSSKFSNIKLQEKVLNMYNFYSREQSVNWANLHGRLSGSSITYIGGEALKWFLSSVVVTGVLWDLTKLTKNKISRLLHEAIERTYNCNLISDSDLHQRIKILDLSIHEVEQLSEHWYRNYQHFFLNLSIKERHVIQQLISCRESEEKLFTIPETLLEQEYTCTIECSPEENITILFPRSVRFFDGI